MTPDCRESAVLVAEPVGWWANCSWHRATGETQLGTFHEGDVRPYSVDRSFGRDV